MKVNVMEVKAFFDQRCNECISFYGIEQADNDIGHCRAKHNMLVVKHGCPCDQFNKSLDP
jgi:hypothetical protein